MNVGRRKVFLTVEFQLIDTAQITASENPWVLIEYVRRLQVSPHR